MKATKTPLKRLGQTSKKSFADVLKKGLVGGKGASLSRSQRARAVLAATQNMHKRTKRTVQLRKAKVGRPAGYKAAGYSLVWLERKSWTTMLYLLSLITKFFMNSEEFVEKVYMSKTETE